MKAFFENIDKILGEYVNTFIELLQGKFNIIYVGIALIVAILILTGLIAALKKFPKFFLFIVFMIAVFCALAYFIYYK